MSVKKRDSWRLVSYDVRWYEPGNCDPRSRSFGFDKAAARAFVAGKKERGWFAEMYRTQVSA